MSVENIKQGSVVAERVSLLLRNGENDKALDLLALNFGPMAKNAMEQVMKYRNLSQDELVRVFGKISDILENAADKMAKNERLNETKEQSEAAAAEAEKIAEAAAAQAGVLERRQQFEARINWIEEQKQKIAAEKKQLELQHKKEKDLRKRRQIEEKLKKLEERRKHLEKERKELGETHMSASNPQTSQKRQPQANNQEQSTQTVQKMQVLTKQRDSR